MSRTILYKGKIYKVRIVPRGGYLWRLPVGLL